MSTATKHVTAVFEDRTRAREAIRALRAAGFTEAQIGVAGPDQDEQHLEEAAQHVGESYAGEGAVTGVAAGAGIGALWGLGILAGALPAIGPAIAGGTLAVLLSSAFAGAAAAGVAGALVGMGIPKEEAEYYEAEVIAGNTIVTVDAHDRSAEAHAILHQHGGRDMAARVASAMAKTDHGEGSIAPPDPNEPVEAGRRQHLDFTSDLPVSPNAAKEQLTGFGTTPVSTPIPETTSGHTSFEIPVERAHLDEAEQQLDEEADMPPKTPVDVPVSEERLNVEKLPPK